jgi:hypothetical protein
MMDLPNQLPNDPLRIYPNKDGMVKCIYCSRLTDSAICKIANEHMQGIVILRDCKQFIPLAGETH